MPVKKVYSIASRVPKSWHLSFTNEAMLLITSSMNTHALRNFFCRTGMTTRTDLRCAAAMFVSVFW